MAQMFDSGIFSVTDGIELGSGWGLAWYVGGTTTPVDTYSTSALDSMTKNANPVLADANGRFPEIWIGAGTYKYVLLNAASVPVVTRDGYIVPDLPPTFDAGLSDFLAGDEPLPIANGGTGETSASNALDALGGLAAAGGPVSGEITRASKGAYLYNAASGMAQGAVYVTASGASDPSSLAGEWWAKY